MDGVRGPLKFQRALGGGLSPLMDLLCLSCPVQRVAGKAGAMAPESEGNCPGDEVTILFSVLACLLVLALAWVSTHTAEAPIHCPSVRDPNTNAAQRSHGGHGQHQRGGPRS